jgi:membrane protease YdiL (CAAX protease family)
MRKAKMWVSLIGLSIFALLILRYFPGSWLKDDYHLNSIIGYMAVAGIFYIAIYLMGLPTLQYFGIPRMRLKALVAVALAFPAPILQIFEAKLEYSSWLDVVSGIAFLLILGFGEEMLSRGFTYGVLLKLGRFRAILFSSLFFGLLHINVYIPEYLGWETYFHVMSTFGFGMVMCGLMIVTRSIWIPVLFHAMIDWHIPFQKKSTPIEDDQVYSLWDNLTMPFFSLAFDVLITLVLLGIDRARMPNLPKWFWRVAQKLKLIEPTPLLVKEISS